MPRYHEIEKPTKMMFGAAKDQGLVYFSPSPHGPYFVYNDEGFTLFGYHVKEDDDIFYFVGYAPHGGNKESSASWRMFPILEG